MGIYSCSDEIEPARGEDAQRQRKKEQYDPRRCSAGWLAVLTVGRGAKELVVMPSTGG